MNYMDLGIILGIAILYIGKEIYKRKTSSKKLDNSIEKNAKIYPVLWRILAMYSNTTRVFITQFHNGDFFYSGQHIQRMSISHEVGHEGIDDIQKNYTDVPISETMHKILVLLKTRGYYIECIREEVQDSKLKLDMFILNINSLIAISICNKKGDIIAVLNVNFSKDIREEESKRMIHELIIKKNQLENILNN